MAHTLNEKVADRKQRTPRGPRKFAHYWKWVAALGFIGILVWTIPAPDIEKPLKLVTAPKPDYAGADGAKINVSLFVADQNHSGLNRVDLEIESGEALEDQIYDTLKKLFKKDEPWSHLFPPETVVREVFVYENMAVISLDGEIKRKFKGGAWTETLVVYSIVNTVIENFERINSARILIDDKESDFFVSHIDITQPFESNFSFMLEENAEQ